MKDKKVRFTLDPTHIVYHVNADPIDWRASAYPRRALERFVEAGWLGEIESLLVGWGGTRRVKVRHATARETPEIIWQTFCDARDPFVVAIGRGGAWTLGLGELVGFSLDLRMDPQHFINHGGTPTLLEVFGALHSGLDTTYAFLEIGGLISRMTAGPLGTHAFVLDPIRYPRWGNYLSPRYVSELPIERLADVPGVETRRTEDGGAYVFMGDDILRSGEPEIEARIWQTYYALGGRGRAPGAPGASRGPGDHQQ